MCHSTLTLSPVPAPARSQPDPLRNMPSTQTNPCARGSLRKSGAESPRKCHHRHMARGAERSSDDGGVDKAKEVEADQGCSESHTQSARSQFFVYPWA